MYRVVYLALLLSISLLADLSPIAGYERFIQKDKSVLYVQKNGDFKFKIKKLIDSDNIYNGGNIDNYDDPYIKDILKEMKPLKVIGAGKKSIAIVFRDEANKKNFLEEFGLDIFKEQKLTVKLYMMKHNKLTLPLHLEVYPFFVMQNRYIQGVISKKLLSSLVKQSEYDKDEKISLEALKTRLLEKYKMDETKVLVKYNKKIELFEVYEKESSEFNSYISKDGRYIVFVDFK
jgi:hypothetical protein